MAGEASVGRAENGRRPSPIAFDHYRQFLRAWLSAAAGKPSLRQLAKRAHCSAALLSSILAGTRDLDSSRVVAFVTALELDEDDARAFSGLVEREHGATLAARRRANQDLLALRQFRSARRLDDLTLELFAEWYLQAIAELARCRGFRPDPEWIARTLEPSITAEQAASAVEILLELGLLVREGDEVRAAPSEAWATSREVGVGHLSRALYRHHLWTIGRARQALELPGQDRDVSAVVLSLSPAGRQRLQEIVRRFQNEVVGLGAADVGDRDRVYTVALQVFPLSATTDEPVS